MLRRCLFLAMSVQCVLLAACQTQDLYVASNTVVGVHAHLNTARTAGSIQIGYDRQFATIIPRSVVPPAEQDDEGTGAGVTGTEAMAVAGCSQVTVDGPFLTGFIENLATGAAARNYATALKNADAAKAKEAADFLTCVRPSP